MKALILVDIQNDFMPTGALPVPDGDAVVPIANSLIPKFEMVVATQDWHPDGHGSFASGYPGKSPGDMFELGGLPQVLWPDHCVNDTNGAEFVDGLLLPSDVVVFKKGTDPTIDSYSGFFDNGKRKSTGLADFLKEKGVEEVVVLGVATDYCVKFTALDAAECGFRTTLVTDGCRGVELNPGDISDALDQLKAAGVTITTSEKIQ